MINTSGWDCRRMVTTQGRSADTHHRTYYECHVTLEGNPATLRPCVEALRWKFSAIDGDPLLGAGIKCYATKHFNVRRGHAVVLHALLSAAATLEELGCTVTRRKVELVLYDDRSSKIRCTGACVECHLDEVVTPHESDRPTIRV